MKILSEGRQLVLNSDLQESQSVVDSRWINRQDHPQGETGETVSYKIFSSCSRDQICYLFLLQA